MRRTGSDEGASLPREPGEPRGYNEPLCPLEDEDDLARYKGLSSYLERYREFTGLFEDEADWRRKGHLIVIAGDTGYGKTSLQQRCAYHLRHYYGEDGAREVCVIDLSNDPVDGDAENVLDHFRAQVMRNLGRYVRAEDLQDLKKDPDLVSAFQALDDHLRGRGQSGNKPHEKPVSLVVLLPQYPSVEELKQYCKVLQKGMVFIAEEFRPEIIERLNEELKSRERVFSRREIAVRVLELDGLTRSDANLLIEGMEEYVNNCPDLRGPGFMDYVNQRFSQNKELSVREFTNALECVVDDALKKGDSEIAYKHVYEYFLGNSARS
jgi:energy-coupling factor transporter ATP-binding protein EcfA2